MRELGATPLAVAPSGTLGARGDRESDMIRSELLQALHKDNPDLRADEIEQVADIFFGEIAGRLAEGGRVRSEEHTSELQSLMRISYAVFCLKNKKDR